MDYPPNSDKFRDAKPVPIMDDGKHKICGVEMLEKRVDKVIVGTAKTLMPKKKGEMGKLFDIFIASDIDKIKSHVVVDVVVPTIKKIISDTVSMILYGTVSSTKENDDKRPLASKVSYRRFYDDRTERERYDAPLRGGSRYDYESIILDSQEEVEDVFRKMKELISSYGLVRLADLYEMVGFPSDYTDNNYGWTSIKTATAVPCRNGWLIKLPRPFPLAR